MAPQWFCNLAGSEIGPLSPTQLKQLAVQGRLRKDDFVRKGTEGEWVRAERVKGLFDVQDESVDSQEPANDPPPLPVVDTGEADKPAARPIPVRTSPDRGDSPTGAPSVVQWRLEKERARRRRTMYLLIGFVVLVCVGGLAVLFRPTSKPPESTAQTAEDSPPHSADSDLDLDLDISNDTPDKPDRTDKTATASTDGTDDASNERLDQKPDDARSGRFAGAIDASTREPVALGTVRVLVESVLLGAPRLERAPGRFARPSNSYLLIRLGLRSSDDAKRVEYNGWSNFQSVSLDDDLGNKYPQKRFRTASVVGQVDRAGLYSDKALADVLVFERPVPKARRLRLELPGIAFGETGSVVFSIPVEMIEELTTDSDAGGSVASKRTAQRETPRKPFDPNADPDGDVSKIMEDIDALGGGDGDDRPTGFGEDEDRKVTEQDHTEGDKK